MKFFQKFKKINIQVNFLICHEIVYSVYLVVWIDYGEIISSVLRLASKKRVSEANKFFTSKP